VCVPFRPQQGKTEPWPAGIVVISDEPLVGTAWDDITRDEMEDAMAQVITKCRLTGHYMFMGMEADPKEFMGRSGPFARKFCPFCACEHSWHTEDSKFLAVKPATRSHIQQAS
jgi:hypothetical protein